MADWSQSVFMQALGWATLNSFWQMAILWLCYQTFVTLFRASSQLRYQLSVLSLIAGFAWFCLTIVTYNKPEHPFTMGTVTEIAPSLFNIFLVSASATYLLLLVIPSLKLLRNWRFVQTIRKEGLSKAALDYRLYVRNIAAHLNIKPKVQVFVSELVNSPVTVGYLKPVILLPVAAINQLTPSQVESILLHELSHIRRMDYLMNLLASFIHTVLYFNPFAKLFMQQIDAERENCCDEMVLQFGYDKLAYCSALLTLEKTANQSYLLALGVAGKSNLLTRIEKIIGMETKKQYKLKQMIPAFAAVLCVLVINSVLMLKDTGRSANVDLTSSAVFSPFFLNENIKGDHTTPSLTPEQNGTFLAHSKSVEAKTSVAPTVSQKIVASVAPFIPSLQEIIPTASPLQNSDLMYVAADEADVKLTKEQKEQVKTSIDATRKLMTTLQWNEVESSMADALDQDEKEQVKQIYQSQLADINWSNLEKNLKLNYDKIDWHSWNNELGSALSEVELNKAIKEYSTLLEQLNRYEKEICSGSVTTCTIAPDKSLDDIRNMRAEVSRRLEIVRSAKEKKVIKL